MREPGDADVRGTELSRGVIGFLLGLAFGGLVAIALRRKPEQAGEPGYSKRP